MKSTRKRQGRSIAYAVLRLLLGLALISSLTLPCIIIISEGGSWSEWLDMAEEIKDFFGNWASAWLLIGFMAFLPLFGLFVIVETARRLVRWKTGALS